ncbi:MAG: YbhN family protein [Geitlerinemataceae cyanobacterium]
MKKLVSRLKPHIRWVILGATLFFLASALRENWREVNAIEIDRQGWIALSLAFVGTMLAQTWAGLVWGWILQEFNQTADPVWATRTFLKTNIAKYLPGNIWHFYRRVWAAQKAGISIEIATLSVVVEPLLMASAALSMGLVLAASNAWMWQGAALAVVATTLHPRVLSPVAERLSSAKAKAFRSQKPEGAIFEMKRYPLRPWLGELGFLVWRGGGFVLIVMALGSVSLSQLPLLISGFSLAWLLGLIIPGAPGGLGVFEATALSLLDNTFSPGLILSSVAVYRIISILAEAGGAGLAILDERWRG